MIKIGHHSASIFFLGHKIKFTNAPLQKKLFPRDFLRLLKIRIYYLAIGQRTDFQRKNTKQMLLQVVVHSHLREVFFFYFFYFFFGNPTFLKQILGLCFALFCNKWINLSRCSELKKISPALKFRISSRSSSFCYNFPILQSTFLSLSVDQKLSCRLSQQSRRTP